MKLGKFTILLSPSLRFLKTPCFGFNQNLGEECIETRYIVITAFWRKLEILWDSGWEPPYRDPRFYDY